jgi:hypothetical protein
MHLKPICILAALVALLVVGVVFADGPGDTSTWRGWVPSEDWRPFDFADGYVARATFVEVSGTTNGPFSNSTAAVDLNRDSWNEWAANQGIKPDSFQIVGWYGLQVKPEDRAESESFVVPLVPVIQASNGQKYVMSSGPTLHLWQSYIGGYRSEYVDAWWIYDYIEITRTEGRGLHTSEDLYGFESVSATAFMGWLSRMQQSTLGTEQVQDIMRWYDWSTLWQGEATDFYLIPVNNVPKTPPEPPTPSPEPPTPEKSDTPKSLTPTASATRKATSDICPDPPCTTATPTTTVTHTPTNTPTATPTITRTPVTPTREITATPATPVVPTPQKESLPAVYEVQDKFKVEFWPPFPLVVGQDRKGDLWIRRGVDYRITLRIPAWMPALKDNCPFCYGKIGDMGPCEDGWGYTPDRAIIHPVPGPGGSYVRYRRVTGLYIEARLRPESVAWIQGELARKYPGAKVYQELYVLADWRDPEGLRPGMRLGPERNLVVESVRDIAQNGRYYTEVVLRQGPGPEPGNPQGRSPWSSERHDPNRPTSVQFRDPGNYDFVVRVTSQVPQSAGCPEPELPGGVAKTGEECWSRLGPDDPWNPYFGPCERMREPIQEEFRPNQPLVVYLVDTTLLGSW